MIGLSGYSRTGKDTVGEILSEHFGFRRLAFAEPLRALVLAQDPFVQLSIDDELPSGIYNRLAPLVETHGWDWAKTHPDVQRLIIRTGEAVRSALGERALIDRVFSRLDPSENYVITDVRKTAEAKAICDHPGVLWRVNRPESSPLSPLDTELEKWHFDAYLNNGGSLHDLTELVATHIAHLAENKEAT